MKTRKTSSKNADNRRKSVEATSTGVLSSVNKDQHLIGNFQIEEDDERVVIIHKASRKDIFDTVVTWVMAFILGTITFGLLRAVLREWDWLMAVFLVAFFLYTVVKAKEGVSWLLSFWKLKLYISKKEETVKVDTSLFARRKFSISEIRTIQLNGIKEEVLTTSPIRNTRTYCTVEIIDRRNNVVGILFVNTSRFIRGSHKEAEAEVYSAGKKLTMYIARVLGVEYGWTGFISK
jgi:hypothetical protein